MGAGYLSVLNVDIKISSINLRISEMDPFKRKVY